MNIKTLDFGQTNNGDKCELFSIQFDDSSEFVFTNFGAAINSIKIPDVNGVIEEINLGFDRIEDYQQYRSFYGVIAGRFANRIADGKFNIDDNEYNLTINDSPNTLHSGMNGLDTKVWKVNQFLNKEDVELEFETISPDGEDGFPGNLIVRVKYTIRDDKSIQIDYFAQTDKATVINLTNHAYFNLSGELKEDVLGHIMLINADRITPVNKNLIPTGNFLDVADTPFDFRMEKEIGKEIESDHAQLKLGRGYDHNFVINASNDNLKFAARCYHPISKRTLEVLTTEPGIQFYTGNFMDGSHSGHGNKVYAKRFGFCLETQHYPNSPNQDNFPTTVLLPSETFKSTTIYKFGIKD